MVPPKITGIVSVLPVSKDTPQPANLRSLRLNRFMSE
jgi:hypothetical protein